MATKFIEVAEHDSACDICLWTGGPGVVRREDDSPCAFVCDDCIAGLKYPEREATESEGT